MKFLRDILVIDIEATDADTHTADPIQLGAILLDKETLEEKGVFVSYITTPKASSEEAYQIHHISADDLKGAPSQSEVAETLIKRFSTDVILSSWVQSLDNAMLTKMFKTSGYEKLPYDHHYLDLWPIAYAHLVKQGYEGSMGSTSMFDAFDLSPREKHDALDDCRRAAEILKIIMDIQS
ncbi:MAG: 3'-5' exonuclease [bacterium]|nr:3'-5' exonuclease [bacterium]